MHPEETPDDPDTAMARNIAPPNRYTPETGLAGLNMLPGLDAAVRLTVVRGTVELWSELLGHFGKAHEADPGGSCRVRQSGVRTSACNRFSATAVDD